MAKPRSKPDSEATAAADGAAPLPFEDAMERLEALVAQLEDGELDLEASLVAFERGVALSRRCSEQLDAAERRIEVLVEAGGETLVRPLQGEGDPD